MIRQQIEQTMRQEDQEKEQDLSKLKEALGKSAERASQKQKLIDFGEIVDIEDDESQELVFDMDHT